MKSPELFLIKKVGNRVAVDTYTFDPMLLQFCVTIATLMNFMQNSDLKVFTKLCLKPTMMDSNIFCVTSP